MRAEFLLDYDVITVERPQKLYLMARFISGPAPGDQSRRPLNLSLVIDRSGSMAGDKIDYTRQAAQFLVQHLGQRDKLSVVLYNDKIETLLQPAPVSNKDAIIQKLERIRVRGTTNLSGGWLEGCNHVANHQSRETLNRVILMSDGLANRGITDPAQLLTMTRQKYEQGISTTTMGMGNDFNEDLMIEMANAGGGAFYFIESPEVAPEIFNEELRGLLNLIGQNLTITAIPTAHVKQINQLNAYPMEKEGQAIVFKLGDVFGEEVKSMVLELDIPALNDIGKEQIATLRFEYDEISGNQSDHRTIDVPVFVNIRPRNEALPHADPEVEESVLLLKAAQARQQAVKAADRGDYEAASRILRDVADAIGKAHVKNKHLQEEQAALLEQAEQMKLGAQTYDEYSRKTMSTQAFYTMTSRHDDTVMLRLRELERRGGPDKPENRQPTLSPDVDPDAKPDEPPQSEAPDASSVAAQPGITPTHVAWKEQIFPLKGDLIRVGRALHNEIIINEPGVSRFHCQIRRENDMLLIEDLGSTNGTRFNNRRLVDAHELNVGDEIYLCDAKLVFQLAPQDEVAKKTVVEAESIINAARSDDDKMHKKDKLQDEESIDNALITDKRPEKTDDE